MYIQRRNRMVYVINLVTSSSPNSSIKLNSSPKNNEANKNFSNKLSLSDVYKTSSLCQSFSTIPRYSSDEAENENENLIIKEGKSESFKEEFKFDGEAFEKFKSEWRKNRRNSSDSSGELENKKRRTSDSFKITPLIYPSEITHDTFNTHNQNRSTSNYKKFKNKLEAMASIRLFLSDSMAEAYEFELRRRFVERPPMGECIAFDLGNVKISSENGSFRWKFEGREEFLAPRLFVLDTKVLWDEFIASRNYLELLRAYNEPNVFLYFINWKMAAQKHNLSLNKQFKRAVVNDGSVEDRLVPANELENEFFLAAAGLRLQVNFSGASNGPQATADLMDFVIELTRIVAQDAFLHESAQNREDSSKGAVSLNLTLTRDVKIRSGKDSRDCWLRALCQIPRVTLPTAEVIAARYPSFCALMEAYDCCSERGEGEELLSELRLDERRIGPVVSARIYNYFYRFS